MAHHSSDSYSFDQDDEGFVAIANELLTKFHLSPIQDLSQCTADVLVALYEGILGSRLIGVIEKPVSREDEITNMQLVINSLDQDVLHVDLSHITGKDIVEGNLTTLRYLLEILAGLMEYVMEQIDSEGSTIDTEGDFVNDPDKLTQGTISSISHVLQDDLSSQSSHTRSKPWHTRAPATVSRPPDDDTSSNSTHELIKLGESAASAYGYNGSLDTELEPAEHTSVASSNADRITASWQVDSHDQETYTQKDPHETMDTYYEETDPHYEESELQRNKIDRHYEGGRRGPVYQAADTTEDLIREGEAVAKKNGAKIPVIIHEEPERDHPAASTEMQGVVPGNQNTSISTASSASWPKPLPQVTRPASEFDSLGLGIRARSVDKGETMERLERALDDGETTQPDLHVHSNLHIHHHYQEPGLRSTDPVYASKLPSSDHIRSYLSASLPDKTVQEERPSTSSAIQDHAATYGRDRPYTAGGRDQPGVIHDKRPNVTSRSSRSYAASAFPDNVSSRPYKADGIPNLGRSSKEEYVPSLSYANVPGEVTTTSKDSFKCSRNNSAATNEDNVDKGEEPSEEVLRYQERALSRQRQPLAGHERTAGFIPARDRSFSHVSEKPQTDVDSRENAVSSKPAYTDRSSKLADLKSQSFPPYESIDKYLPSQSKHTSERALPKKSTHDPQGLVDGRTSRSKHLSGVALPARPTHDPEHFVGGRTSRSSRSKHQSGGSLPARSTHVPEHLVGGHTSRSKHVSGGNLPTRLHSTEPILGNRTSRSKDISRRTIPSDHTSQDSSQLRQSNLTLESHLEGQGGQHSHFERRPGVFERLGRSKEDMKRQYPVPRITKEIVPPHSDSDLDESATFSDSQIEYSREPSRGKSSELEGHNYNLRSNGTHPLSRKPSDKRPPSKRPTGMKRRSVLIAPPDKPNLKVRFEDALDADANAKGEIGKIRKKLHKEKKTQERQKQVLQTVYASNLKEVKENLKQNAAIRKKKIHQEDAIYKAAMGNGKPRTSQYQPARKYTAKVAAPVRTSRAPVHKKSASKRKRSASSSPVPRRSRRQLQIGDDEMLPTVMQEFPFLHVSPHTAHNMWSKQMRQMEQLTKAGLDLPSKNKTQIKMEEAERRQQILMNIMKKELAHNQRMRDIKERRTAERVMASKAREQKQVTAKARQYYDDFRLRAQSRMLKKKNREEQIFKKLFENGLAIQKSRIHEMRKYAKEKRQQNASRQQDEIESLENYYRDQFGMLAETIAKERHDLHVRDNAQNKVMDQMKRELRKKMEKDVRDFQEQLYRDEDSEYFRQIEADRMESQLQTAHYKTYGI